MRILQFGASGQLAREMIARAPAHGVDITALSREAVDLRDAQKIARVIERADADLVVNAAAYTAVDKAEADEALAFEINALAPRAVAGACAARGLPMVQISTDYVFDGSKAGAWTEDESPNPINAYGRTKLAGERAVLASPRTAVIRASWVFSAHGQNFVKTTMRLARERKELKIVADQVGRPTYAGDLAALILATAPRWAEAPAGDAAFGITHFANQGVVSWKGFAEAIVQAAGLKAKVVGIPTAEYPTPAKRPANSVLCTERLTEVFGVSPRHWREGLAETLQILKAEAQ